MKLLVERLYNKDTYCIGKLYVDGKYFCDTLEDCDRGLDNTMTLDEIQKKKVYGETCIPTGIYKLVLVESNRFGRIMPRLLNVKGFDGILIHSGNVAADTEGCLLVGLNKIKGKVIDSRNTYWKLYDVLGKANGNITIEIKRKYQA